MTNGRELADIIRRGAKERVGEGRLLPTEELIANLFIVTALGRQPTAEELDMAKDIVGRPAQAAGVEDLLWALAMLPEFQLIF